MAGLVIGVLAGGIIAAVAISKGQPVDWKSLSGLVLGIGVIVPAFVLPTLLVSIRIQDGVISHWFLRRWKLSEGRVDELEKIEIAVSTGAKFYFENSRGCISFMGADLMILQEMCLHIIEQRPDFDQFVFGSRAATILKTVRLFQSKKQTTGSVET